MISGKIISVLLDYCVCAYICVYLCVELLEPQTEKKINKEIGKKGIGDCRDGRKTPEKEQ